MKEVPKRRDRSASKRGIPPEERDTYRMAILPHNPFQSKPLSRKRRATFEANLRRNLAKARARLAAEEEPQPVTKLYSADDSRTDAEREAERKLLGTACGMCRGRCCIGGADHAFNDSDTMMRYLQRNPDHDDETIVDRYLSYIAPRTLSPGCIYQHKQGCTLPRDLRADICNRFYCGDISVVRNHYFAGDPVRAYFLHQDGGRLLGGRFVDIPVATAAGSDSVVKEATR
jgi:hypothetical protein